MDGIRIIHLGPEDHDILLRVEPGLFDRALEPAEVFSFLAQGTHEMVLAMAAGHAVGMASGVVILHPDKPPQFFVNEVDVRENYRRQGIGTALIQRLRDIAMDRGCVDVWLAAEGDDLPARRLFRSMKAHETEHVVIYDWSDSDDFI